MKKLITFLLLLCALAAPLSASQNSLVVPDGTGAQVRAGFNNAIDTLNTVNSGPSAPATTEAYMLWADTTNNLLKQRDAANATWIVLGTLGAANLGLEPAISLGTTSQYWRGDKTWQTLPTGLSYPGAGVANSNGNSWLTSYQVGTAANDLVQLNSSAQLPAVDGSQLTNLPAASIPAGVIVPYAGSTAPSGWLLCYGQQVSTSTYANLYAAIGTTYGSGSGTFGIPDLRGRAAFGADAMGGTAAGRLGSGNTGGITGSATLGASGGQQSHTLTTAEIPSGLGTFWNGFSGGQGVLDSAPNAAASATTASAGGDGGAHNITPPALVLNYLIKY
ncbi:MAG: tail fiber protein [Desulfobaccales bacterium]